MFNTKRIQELVNEINNLRGMIIDLNRKIEGQAYIYLNSSQYSSSYYLEAVRKVPITNILENLLKTLGYEISYIYKPETESYSLKKIIEIPKRKIKKKKKEGRWNPLTIYLLIY